MESPRLKGMAAAWEDLVAAGGHGGRRGKVAVHIASLLGKQRVNRKWGQAVKPQGPPCDSLPPARCHLLKDLQCSKAASPAREPVLTHGSHWGTGHI